MSALLDRLVQGAAPAAQFDLLQASSGGAAGWAQGSTAHEAVTGIGAGPGYSNSWVDSGGSWEVGGFYKDPLGRVYLRGQVGSGTVGGAIFTLPSGYRPAKERSFLVWAVGGGGQLTITAAGVVTPDTACANTRISLDGVSFDLG